MAESACPKCSGTHFECVSIEPDNLRVEVSAIQCTSCGAIVGILEDEIISEAVCAQIDTLDADIAGKLEFLNRRISELTRELSNALEILQTLQKWSSRH
jgi:hypothetical protein